MGIEDEADRTLFIRNLDPRVTEELLFELFLQVLLTLTLARSANLANADGYANTDYWRTR